MIYSKIHEALNSDIAITYLWPYKMTEKQLKKNFYVSNTVKPYSRFFLVLNGKTTFTFNGADGKKKKVSAGAGDIVYLPNDLEYNSYWENINEINHISIVFNITDSYNQNIVLNPEIVVITHDNNEILHNAFENIYNLWCRGEIGYKIKCRSLFYDILTAILKDCLKYEYSKKHNDIYKSILYLENNYLEEISVANLAKMSNMCETSFRSKFKSKIGMTPIEYKNYLKIKKAAELLKSGEYSVYEAADFVNITEMSYFHKLFKKHYKTTPAKYAKQ